MDDRLRWVEFSHELFIILHSVCERLEVDCPMLTCSLKDVVLFIILFDDILLI